MPIKASITLVVSNLHLGLIHTLVRTADFARVRGQAPGQLSNWDQDHAGAVSQ